MKTLMESLVIGALAALLAYVAAPRPANGQMVCDERDKVMETLMRTSGESPAAIGLGERGQLLEIVSTLDGATWSAVVHNPDGTSCLVATGTDWQSLRAEDYACEDNPSCI